MYINDLFSTRKIASSFLVPLLVLLLSWNVCLSQAPDLPNVISSTSPTAASLAKYIDFPVSLANGVPDISIPLYELKSLKLSVPVGLSYHAAGIKVSERTSTMGLGWTLNAGGAITRSIQGLPDDTQNGFLSMVWPPEDTTAAAGMQYDSAYCLANRIYNRWAAGLADNLYDGEPDIFYYNAQNIGGKFLFRNTPDANGQRAITIPYAPVKIDISSTRYIKTFTITHTDGTVYQFGDPSEPSADTIFDETASNELKYLITAWHLKKIISADRTDTVLFYYQNSENYSDFRISTLLTASFGPGMDPNNPPALITHSSTNKQETNMMLTGITCKTGKVIFNYGTLGVYHPLLTIDIYATVNGADQKIRTITLNQSTFSGAYNTLRLDSVSETGYKGAVSVTQPPYRFTYNSSDAPPYNTTSQDFWGYYNGYTNYTGNSDNSNLLMVNVMNGKIQYAPEKRTANPTYMGKAMIQRITYPTGGYTDFTFEPNQIVATVQVITPAQPVTQHISTMNIWPGSGTTGNDITFSPISTSTTAQITISGFLFCSPAGTNCVYEAPEVRLTDVTTNQVILDQTLSDLNSGQVTSQTFTQTISGIVPTHQYRLYFPNNPTLATNTQNFQFRVDAEFTQIPPDDVTPEEQTVYAGGLRIKRITSNDGNNNTLIKDYNYTHSYFTSNAFQGDFYYLYNNCLIQSKQLGGQLDPQPTDPFTGYLSSKYYMESPSFPFGGASNCGIAYQEVEELQSAADASNTGKTVYTFNQAQDYIPNRLPSIRIDRESIRKQLLETKVYKNVGGSYDLVKDIQNVYSNISNNEADARGHDSIRFFIAIGDFDYAKKIESQGLYPEPGWSAPGCPMYQLGFPYTLIPMYYHAVKELLTSTITTDYGFSGGTPLVSTVNYTYGNYAHLQPTRITSTGSNQQIDVQTMSYPLDYSNLTASSNDALGIKNLQNLHVVTSPVEKSRYKQNPDSSNTRLVASVFTSYNPTIPVAGDIYTMEVASPLTNFSGAVVQSGDIVKDARYKKQLSFQYDSKAHIVTQQKVNNFRSSYIWDYSGVYPVAEAKNADTGSIAYTSFEADGSGHWTIGSSSRDTLSAITGTRSYVLNSNISKSGLSSTTTYIVSYWTQNGSPFSIVGTVSGYPSIGKTINGWTLYVHKITGQSTITINGSGHIDELRLYPSSAQMTTYTYQPLVGLTSQCDIGNRVTYYEYDGLQRLRRIRDQDQNIVKTFDYRYQDSGCGPNCYSIAMETLAGTSTPGYPVGVFNVHGKLLGNVTGASQYVNVWNADTADSRIGTLATGADSLHFNMSLNTGMTMPAGVTGCRYYQVDLSWNKLDAIRSNNAAYVDFGDGTRMKLGATLSDSVTILAANTVQTHPTWDPHTWYFVHTYADTSQKTLTFYHNDATEITVFDNLVTPATSLSYLKNLRGNLPQYTPTLQGNSYQQSSMLSVAGVTNWSSIHSITSWAMSSGDGGITPCLHLNYGQDFMAGNPGLLYITTYYSYTGYFDSTFKLSRLKSDWNIYFTHLQAITISDAHWNRENLSGLKELNHFSISPAWQNYSNSPTGNSQIPLPKETVDTIFMQIAAGAGQTVTGGTIFIYSGGSGRTSSSDTAINALLSKGWILFLDGNRITSL